MIKLDGKKKKKKKKKKKEKKEDLMVDDREAPFDPFSRDTFLGVELHAFVVLFGSCVRPSEEL